MRKWIVYASRNDGRTDRREVFGTCVIDAIERALRERGWAADRTLTVKKLDDHMR